MLSQYPHFKIAPNTWEINEFDGASIYLLEGRHTALLIDTGIGIGDLPTFCRTLTEKPIRVLLTHNHRDHVGNAPSFGQVYISELDQRMGPMLPPLTTLESRQQFADGVKLRHPSKSYPWTACDFPVFTPAQEPSVQGITDGFVFDLGNRTVQCFYCPGHTPGSMVAIDRQTGYLFAGDCCNKVLGLGVRPIPGMQHASMEEALVALRRLDAMDFDHTRVYNGHSDGRIAGEPLDKTVLPRLIRMMEQITSGVYHAEKQEIAMIGAETEVVTESDIRIQFHSEQIHGRTEAGHHPGI